MVVQSYKNDLFVVFCVRFISTECLLSFFLVLKDFIFTYSVIFLCILMLFSILGTNSLFVLMCRLTPHKQTNKQSFVRVVSDGNV